MTPEDYLKRPYTFCLIWDEESKTYAGKVLEFPGCFTQGDAKDILDNLYWAALDWIAAALDQDQEIPEAEGKV